MIQKRISFICLILITIFVNSCGNNLVEINESLQIDRPGVELIKNLKVIYSERGKVRAVLQSPKVLNFIEGENPYQEFPIGSQVRFLEKEDSTICTLQAKYGIKYTRKKITEIRDSVKLQSSDGKTMTTEELFWDENKKMYYSDKTVKVVTPDEEINGIGFTSREDFTQYKVMQVTGYKYVNANNDEIELK